VFLELVVYPIVSLSVLLIGFGVLRPMIVARNRILCLVLSLIVGLMIAIGFYVFGGAFVMGAAHMDWPYPLFMVVYVGFLVGLPVVPMATAYLIYRRTRDGVRR
jgi:cell shape-determining protein MreD